ncbi:O-antigen translocase [Nonlabens xiamenensis]|uniref:O-antigen translocase n=1 Tax=Nonlabens xiamenensis TaxID=2341043 RepID=UPI000F6069D8|nr:O-antigen translocase [Nonlabens xiamenensis]
MRRLLHSLNKNLLLKLAGFNSLHVFLKIGTGALMSHLLAIYVGAAGMGILGNLRNFVQGVLSFSVLGLENGMVKHVAQFQENIPKLRKVLSTAKILMFIASLVAGILIFLAAPWLDQQLIAVDTSFANLFRWLAICLPFYVVFVFFSSLLQGFQWYKKFIWVNICISVLVFGISAYSVYQYNLSGALYVLVVVPVIQAMVAWGWWHWGTAKTTGLSKRINFSFDTTVVRQLLKYSLMALFSALMIPLVHILIRTMLMEQVSDEAAGWWEAVTRVSSYYMMFVTSLISMYVLPSLSKNSSRGNYRSTIWGFYKNILPLVIIGLVAVYLCREWIVAILFTAEFEGALPMFKWQLVGDFVKIITTVMAFRFIAQNDLRRYLTAEIISIASFYIFSWYAIPVYAEEGVVIAYLANYIVYFVCLLILLRKDLFKA